MIKKASNVTQQNVNDSHEDEGFIREGVTLEEMNARDIPSPRITKDSTDIHAQMQSAPRDPILDTPFLEDDDDIQEKKKPKD